NQRGIEESGHDFGANSYISNLMYRNAEDFVMVTGAPVGTVRADPLFARFATDGSGDSRLRPDSPAIGAGTQEGAPVYDFALTMRPQAGAIDIGPYEHCEGSCIQFTDSR